MVSRPLFTRIWPHLHTNDKKANDFFRHTCYVSDVTYPLAPYAKLTDCCSSRQQLLAAAPSSFSTRYGGSKRRKAAQTGTAENRHPTTDGGPQIEKGEEKKWWGKAARSVPSRGKKGCFRKRRGWEMPGCEGIPFLRIQL